MLFSFVCVSAFFPMKKNRINNIPKFLKSFGLRVSHYISEHLQTERKSIDFASKFASQIIVKLDETHKKHAFEVMVKFVNHPPAIQAFLALLLYVITSSRNFFFTFTIRVPLIQRLFPLLTIRRLYSRMLDWTEWKILQALLMMANLDAYEPNRSSGFSESKNKQSGNA